MHRTPPPSERFRLAERQVDWVLAHANTSAWLKEALRTAREHDPVTLLNDIEFLQTVLQVRGQALIEQRLASLDN